MRSVKFLVVALVSIMTFASCDKETKASLTLERNSLYFSSWSDDAQVVSYVAHNAVNVAIASYSHGWEASIDTASRTITVRPVGTSEEGMTNDDLPKEGSLVVNALNKEGQATSYYIYLYVTQTQYLDAEGKANCYVISTPSTSYAFDVMHRPDGSELATNSVELLWQSNHGVVKHVNKMDNSAVFYIGASDEDATKVVDTNAVIAAYDASGVVVWSWHLWIVNENPFAATDTYSNGKVFMQKNLGAFTNANGSTEEQKIINSYGMYYQWGRKDPFPRPLYFDATGAYDEDRYNEDGIYIKEVFAERTFDNGNLDYVTKNPMHFILNASCVADGGDGVGDWLTTTDNTLWSDTEKSVYDPCPKGWRVPTADDLSVLKLSDDEDNKPLDGLRKQFGWHLSDDAGKYFWSACGRRRYNDGKVENMNSVDGVYPSQPQPWEGYYWTSSTTTDGKAVSLYFDLTTTRTINNFYKAHPARRANGFQVRCVKE